MNLQQNLNGSVLLGKQTQSHFQEDLTLKAFNVLMATIEKGLKGK